LKHDEKCKIFLYILIVFCVGGSKALTVLICHTELLMNRTRSHSSVWEKPQYSTSSHPSI